MLHLILEVRSRSPLRITLIFKTSIPSGPGGSRTWYESCSNSIVGAKKHVVHMFTFMHLADHFMQSNIHMNECTIQAIHLTFFENVKLFKPFVFKIVC